MLIKINYGVGAGVFPTSCAEQVKRASLSDLKVLWLICAKGGAVEMSELCDFAGASESEVMSSLSYWRGAGVIECEIPKAADKGQKAPEPQAQKPKKIARADALPEYTSDEIANILEKNTELSSLIDECQRIMGKMFNIHEVNVLIGLVDYLDLDCDYIMLLLTYCVAHGKKTLHYAEKTAFGFYDSGITTVEALSAELQRRENVASVEGKIRTLFGLGGRALTTKEKKEISAWINDWGFSFDIIEKAYETTVDATGGASLHYANSVLERWNSEGIRTLEQINASAEKFEAEKAQKKTKKSPKNKGESENQNSSFDTDEFFEAAIRRSLGGALKEHMEETNSNIDTDKLFEDLVHHKIGGEKK